MPLETGRVAINIRHHIIIKRFNDPAPVPDLGSLRDIICLYLDDTTTSYRCWYPFTSASRVRAEEGPSPS